MGPREGTALVTGASSGIGRGFARELAARGFDLVLVARREAPLRTLAAEIAAAQGIATHILPADLSDPDAPLTIKSHIDSLGLEIDLLVNNAGFGVPGHLCDVDWQRHRDVIEVMAAAPVHLSYLLAPAMAGRGRGWIVNIASLSAFLPPHAGGTLYYPVKSFLLQFSLAHRAELLPAGVKVTAVCPGFTETNFQKAAGGSVESVSMPRFLWSTPEQVAKAGCDAVMQGRPICIPGLVNKGIFLAFRLMPGPLARWFVRGES